MNSKFDVSTVEFEKIVVHSQDLELGHIVFNLFHCNCN